jgi:catechol 2,3-dioxygenase-like lactoylglutathione lyase family enzyme
MRPVAIAFAVSLLAGLAQSQPPQPAQAPQAGPTSQGPPDALPPPAPTGLIVGSNNYFSPIVRDLDKAVAFYRDGLGLEPQGPQGDASSNPALRNMFGLPDAKLRWQITRTAALRGGVEIVEVSGADGKPLERRFQDPGAYTLIAIVRDLDATLARLKGLGAPITTLGAVPATLPYGPGQQARMVMLKDPDGHFVEIVQPDRLPETQAPPTANVIGVRVRFTVDDVEEAMRLYRDALGMKALNSPSFSENAAVSAALGVQGGQYRVGMLQVPTTGLVFEVMDFKGVERHDVEGRIQDPGSTRIQLQVSDVDAAIAAFAKFGGKVVSTGGRSMDLPVGDNKLKVAIVRDPDNLFVVLIGAPPAATR